MTLIALTHCCHLLGIDGKTLRRWLAQAQLPVQAHPSDARCKGLSSDHLLLLASTHHRRLTDLPESAPTAPPGAVAELSAELLGTLQTLGALPAQLAALQQQVADLTRLVTQHGPGLTIPLAPRPQTRMAKPPARSTPAAPRSRRAAQLPSKPTHVIPRVEYGRDGRYVVTCPTHSVLSLELDTPEWFAWVAKQSSFRFVGKCGHFTAHHEWRVPKGAWRAHRHIRNRVHTLRLAPNHELTSAVLEQAAATFQARLS